MTIGLILYVLNGNNVFHNRWEKNIINLASSAIKILFSNMNIWETTFKNREVGSPPDFFMLPDFRL